MLSHVCVIVCFKMSANISNHQRLSPSATVLVALFLLYLVLASHPLSVTEAAPAPRTPLHQGSAQHQSRSVSASAVSPSGGAAAGAGQQHRGRPARPATSTNGGTHNYTIVRPGACRGNDMIYADCFLCGKIADNPRIYTDCCEREPEIVRFCQRLLE